MTGVMWWMLLVVVMFGCNDRAAGSTVGDAPPVHSQSVSTQEFPGDPFGSSYCLPAFVDQIDTDPNDPGIQPECTVTDVQDAGSSDEAQQLIPTCTMSDPTTVSTTSSTPCWWTDENASSCPDAPSFEINFVAGQSPIPADTTTVVNCALVTP